MPLEEEIKKDVRKWSEHFLEIPNKHLGGFPACPFAICFNTSNVF